MSSVMAMALLQAVSLVLSVGSLHLSDPTMCMQLSAACGPDDVDVTSTGIFPIRLMF